MKYLPIYDELFGCKNEDEVFNYLKSNLKPLTINWKFFTNWNNVFRNIKNLEISLNTLNYLIGKENFDEEFKYLIKKQPELLKVFPFLLVRNSTKSLSYNLLVDEEKYLFQIFDFSIENPTEKQLDDCLFLLEKTGLKSLIADKKITNLSDYIIGAEAGLNSHSRKNSSGHLMEDWIELYIKSICLKNNFAYLKEANADKIKKEFGYDVPVDKSSRRYDFVIKTDSELVIIEVNFYNSSGSKLKSTAGEYRNLYDVLDGKYKFIWITDGSGWLSSIRPLEETFNHNDYLVSLAMLEKGILDKIL